MASSKRPKRGRPAGKAGSSGQAQDVPRATPVPSQQPHLPEVGNPWPDGLPSQVVDNFWIKVHAEEPVQRISTPKDIPREGLRRIAPGGKWLLFVDRKDVDEVWAKIVPAVKGGRLGHLAKVATACPNSLARKANKHGICVYTADAEDRQDVLRVREELRRLGFVARISYKPDAATLEGKYEGSGRIATYYE